MNSNQKIARIVGVLFIIGTVSGVLSLMFTEAIFSDPNNLVAIYENQPQVTLGAIFVLVMGLALMMIPVVMFPIFKKYNEALALGAVVFRGTLEAITYMGIVVCWLLMISLSWEFFQAGSPESSSFQTLGALLQGAEKWIGMLLNIVFSIGALMIYYLFYISKLVPRWLSIWGLAGAALYLLAPFIFLLDPQNLELSLASEVGYLMIPLAIQEMVFALWVIVKGFNETVTESSLVGQINTSQGY